MSRKATQEIESESEVVVNGAETSNTNEQPTATTEAPAPERPKIETVDVSSCGTNKSAKIRQYTALGYSRSEIAKHMDIKYQFVRNVLMQPVPKAKG